MNIETELRQWIRQGYVGTRGQRGMYLDRDHTLLLQLVLDQIARCDVEQAALPQFGVATFSKLNGPQFFGDKTFLEAAAVFQKRSERGRFCMLVHVLRRSDHVTPAEIQDTFDERHELGQISDDEAARVWGKVASDSRRKRGSAALRAPLRWAANAAGTIPAKLRNGVLNARLWIAVHKPRAGWWRRKWTALYQKPPKGMSARP